MLVYISLRVFDDNLHPLYARTLSDWTIPARKDKNVPSTKRPTRIQLCCVVVGAFFIENCIL